MPKKQYKMVDLFAGCGGLFWDYTVRILWHILILYETTIINLIKY